MELDNLMAVWRSQDSAPLHGVNETLLRLALRRDEAKLQAQRRLARGITYLMSAFFVAVMVFFFVNAIHKKLTGWDCAIPVVGAVAGLFWPSVIRASYRAQARREQSFGTSLREQLNRHRAQVDYEARKFDGLTFHMVNNLPATVWSIALFFATLRFNGKSFGDAWSDPRVQFVFVGMVLFCTLTIVGTIWFARLSVKRHLLPQKRRLEALLHELDGQ